MRPYIDTDQNAHRQVGLYTVAGVLAVGPIDESRTAAARLIAACERFPVFTPSGIGSFARRRQRQHGSPGGRRPRPESDGQPPDPHTAPIRPRSQATGRRPGELPAPRRSSGALDDSRLSARHKYFRETLLDGNEVYAPGTEEYLANQCLAEAAPR